MADDPTTAEMLAGCASVAFRGRRMIENTNHSLPAEMLATLETLHNELATVGGAAMLLAAQLGVEAEVQTMTALHVAHKGTRHVRTGEGGRA